MAAQFAVVDAFLYGLPDVRPRDREVYLGLAFLANRETGMFFARVDEIAQWLGVGRSTAQKRISRLIELGLLQRRLMWLDPDNPQGRPQYKRVIANGQRASDFRLLRQADGFPDDVFTRSLNEASQSSEAPHSDATSTEFRESAQGLTSEPTQGLTSEPTQGLRTEAHNRELSTKNSQQRTKPPASPLRAAGPTTAEPDDLDRARRGERTTTAMTLPPDFRGNPATRAEAAELGLDHDAAVRALRTAEGGDTARNWGGTLVNYMRTISGHTDDLQHTHRWQDADELYAEAFDELYGDGSSGGSLTEGSGSTCSPVDPPATQQVPPATQQDFPCETAGPPLTLKSDLSAVAIPTGPHREPTSGDKMRAVHGIATAVPVHLQPKFTGGDASKDRAGELNLDHGRAVAGFIEWCRDTERGPSRDWSSVFAEWLAAVVKASHEYPSAAECYERAPATPPPTVVIPDYADDLCPF